MYDENDWRWLYPFDSKFLEIDGHQCHYIDEGAATADETLLLVHGNPTWSFYWRNVVLALRDRYRVVALDHIGCGLSDKPQIYEYTLSQHVANLESLISELNLQNVTVVGHDWGGAIGIGAAQRLPQRISRIVLMNTAAFRSTRIPLRIRVCRIPLLGELAMRRFNAFSRAAVRMATAMPERLTAQVRAGYIAPYDSWANRIAVARFVQDIPLKPSHKSYPTLEGIEEGLSKFRDKPLALIWGMRDWCFTPQFLERFEEYFPQAEVTRIDGAGHWVVEDACDEVVAAIEGLINDDPASSHVANVEGQAIKSV